MLRVRLLAVPQVRRVVMAGGRVWVRAGTGGWVRPRPPRRCCPAPPPPAWEGGARGALAWWTPALPHLHACLLTWVVRWCGARGARYCVPVVAPGRGAERSACCCLMAAVVHPRPSHWPAAQLQQVLMCLELWVTWRAASAAGSVMQGVAGPGEAAWAAWAQVTAHGHCHLQRH